MDGPVALGRTNTRESCKNHVVPNVTERSSDIQSDEGGFAMKGGGPSHTLKVCRVKGRRRATLSHQNRHPTARSGREIETKQALGFDRDAGLTHQLWLRPSLRRHCCAGSAQNAAWWDTHSPYHARVTSEMGGAQMQTWRGGRQSLSPRRSNV